jgi:peptidyl-prolyl cis-trans isomerase SurA
VAKVIKGNGEKMNRILLRFLIFLFLCGLTSSSEAVVDRIVAVVNQEIITLSEVEKSISSLQEEIQTEDRWERKERLQVIFRKALEHLIDEKLIDQEVKKAGIKVASKEVDGAIEEVKRRNAATQEDLERALAKDGLTLEAYRKQLEKSLQRMKFIQMSAKMESNPGEKEWRNFYQKNPGRYRSSESYRPAHILLVVPKKATPEEILEIRKKCQSILEKIMRGEDFGEMAILYSDDLSGKDRGDMGYFKKGELLPAFEKEALRLQVGEVSGIVRTDFGFHLIKLLDRKGGTPLPYEEVRNKVMEDYYQWESERIIKQLLSTLKEKAVIEIKL